MRLKNKKMGKLVIFLLAAILCALVIAAALASKPADSATTQALETPAKGMPVSVRRVEPQARSVVIRAHGEARPIWQTTLRAQVDGQVDYLGRGLRAGTIVKRGEVLLRLTRGDYEHQVAEVKSRLAAAEVTLFREEREVKEAKRNWKRSGIQGRPGSPLVLRQPQLLAARSELDAARAALNAAQTRLSHTEIGAPFDGVILKRSVNPGESLFVGDAVATLYNTDAMEIRVHLNAHQWSRLPAPLLGSTVTVKGPQQSAVWEARVVRQGRSISQASRQRALFLQVQQPLDQTPPLLPGTFVQAEIVGREIADLLAVPEAALTKAGQVWFVDADNRLRPRRLEALFFESGLAYIQAQAEMAAPLRVAVYPNSSFTRGLPVQPLMEEKEG